MSRPLFLALTCATVAIAGAQATPRRTIGILEVPRLFNLYSPEGLRIPPDGHLRIDLRAGPAADSPVAATISAPDQLESKEYDYEELGALVYARIEGWSLIRTRDGLEGWLSPADAGAFHSLESLITRGLPNVTSDWNGLVSAQPGSDSGERLPGDPAQMDVRTVTTRHVGGVLWVEIEVVSHSWCEDPDTPPAVLARGWIPAHAPSGAPNIWFSSRGC